ncbi:MAG TPA: hypothetical protein VJB90_02885 [Candidatus Nanoarchaeia archaeon]|nr:hypothetical protein [Candidatus Nanoarchaeia archaeon]
MAKINKSVGVTVVSIIQGIEGVLALVGALVLLAGGAFLGSYRGMMPGYDMAGFLSGFVAFFGIILLVVGILDLVAAYGVWNLTSWGRILSTVLAALGLLSIPIGTIIGIVIIYLLWFHEETKKAFK